MDTIATLFLAPFLIIPIIIGVLIMVILIINIVNPRFLWEKFESWKAVKEPDESYFKSRRIISIIALIILFIMFTFPFITGILGNLFFRNMLSLICL